jgi:hypothetical protein
MKRLMTAAVLMTVWGAGEAGAKVNVPGEEVTVRVYISLAHLPIPGSEILIARMEASRIFQAEGIRLEWLGGKVPEGVSGPRTIGITSVGDAPIQFRNTHSGRVLAMARPYGTGPEGIVVFGDRVAKYLEGYRGISAGKLLGHILAHEIGHVVEGIARHSTNGLMKANWTRDDLREMTGKGMNFSAEDRLLLEAGGMAGVVDAKR